MATWYMRDGDYPYCEWQTSETSPVLPVSFWKMKDGDYPYQPWQTKETDEEIPINLWRMKDGDYPYRIWQKKKSSKLLPYGIWCQEEGAKPYINGVPIIYNLTTYPDMLWHQIKEEVPYKNWAKLPIVVNEDGSGVIYFKVVIYDYTQKITVDDYLCKVISDDF